MNVKEKDLVHKALGLAESVGSRVESGYWLKESKLGQLPITKRWRDIAYGDGVIVAVGYGNNSQANNENIRGTITGSWQKIDMPEWQWEAVTYGDGVFIAGGSGNTENGKAHIARSEDGISWTKIELPTSSAYIVDIAYGDGKFLAITESSNYAFYSDNGGLTWTVGTKNTSGASYFQSVAYCNGYFYIGLDNGWGVYRTVDGKSFDSVFSGGSGYNDEAILRMTSGGDIVMALGYSKSHYYGRYRYIIHNTKTNSEKYVDVEPSVGREAYVADAAYGDGVFLISPSNLTFQNLTSEFFVVSEDTPEAYTSIEAPSEQYWGPSCYCNGKFISLSMRDASSNKGTSVAVFASSDGNNWSDEFGNYMTNSTGTDKTTEVLNALNGIQTNTLDAAYTAGVNAYQGE